MMMVKQMRLPLNMITQFVLNKYYLCSWRQNKAVPPTKVQASQAACTRYLCSPTSNIIFDFSNSYAGHPCAIFVQSILCTTFFLLK